MFLNVIVHIAKNAPETTELRLNTIRKHFSPVVEILQTVKHFIYKIFTILYIVSLYNLKRNNKAFIATDWSRLYNALKCYGKYLMALNILC